MCSTEYTKQRLRGYSDKCKKCYRKEIVLSWKRNNPDRKRELNRRWTEENREQDRLSKRKWQQANPEYVTAKAAKYRANKRNAVPTWADMNKIKEIYLNCPENYEVDHIVPLQGKKVCGLHVENNLQYLLVVDNRIKSNRFEGNP